MTFCLFKPRFCLMFVTLLISVLFNTRLGFANELEVQTQQRKLVIVTIDGLRWQEVFKGADLALAQSKQYNSDPSYTLERFWRENQHERRELLMPFLTNTLEKEGLMVGNREQGSLMRVSNKQLFSYPGYNEIFTGHADPSIRSNAKRANTNVTFLEWLNKKPEFHKQIAVFSGWDVFPDIYNRARSGLIINAGFEPFTANNISENVALLNTLQHEIPSPWRNVRHDAFTYGFAKEYLLSAQPKVLVVNLGETDDFAHNGKYDAYLDSAQQTDAYLADLWQTLQSIPGYQNNTNLLIITDHGRGSDLDNWQHHASLQAIEQYMQHLREFENGIEGAEHIWFAAMGPDIKPMGVKRTKKELSQSQFAASALATLGFHVGEYSKQAMPAMASIFKANSQAFHVANRQFDKQVEQHSSATRSQSNTQLLFGSCSHQDKAMPIFDAILQEQKEAFIFLGDNIYGDTEDMQVLKEKYAKLGENKGIKRLRETTPVFAIWDDHDFGENDAGKDYPFKDASKDIMLDFWNVPQNSPRRSRPDGLYGSYVIGKGERAIRIILPDLRYARDNLDSVGRIGYLSSRRPNDMGPYKRSAGSMLGDAQWAWLEAELQQKEPIKIIGSSLQVLADFTGWESWSNYNDKQRLFDLIKKHQVNGVMMISGDTHWGEISKHTSAVAYPLYDITSSGLTEEWKQVSPNKHRTYGATAEVNYGFIQVNWLNDPQITAGLKDVNGDIVMQTTFSLSSISAY